MKTGMKSLRFAMFLVLLGALSFGAVTGFAADDWGDDFGEEKGAEEGGLPPGGEEISTEEVSKRLKELLSERDKIRYEPKIRRDPFVSLVEVNPGPNKGPQGPRPDGFPGRNVSELRLSGTWLGGPDVGRIGFLLDPKGKSYMQKVGDRCFNGKIIEVTEDRVVFEEYQFGTGGKPRPPKIVTLFFAKGGKVR